MNEKTEVQLPTAQVPKFCGSGEKGGKGRAGISSDEEIRYSSIAKGVSTGHVICLLGVPITG